jgi:hypothetical protein
MKTLKNIILLLCAILLLNSCGATYPKKDLIPNLEKLIKKECDQDSKAYIFGKTLYLDMELDGITSKDQETASKAIRKIQLASFAVVRVVLSGDAEIKYMVATAYDRDKSVVFRIIQSIDDVKKYFYMRISRSDYESRNLLEIAGYPLAAKVIDDKHDISDDEYVGRLIVSQVNMLSRTNPLFGALISMLQLQYIGIDNKTLYLSVSDYSSDVRITSTLTNILQEDLQTYSKKYAEPFDTINVITSSGKTALMVSLND